MRSAAHGHQSNYQGASASLRFEGDVEKRIQARIAKDQIRIKEFFIDFDKLRKGTVGEAAVSLTARMTNHLFVVPHLHQHSRCQSH